MDQLEVLQNAVKAQGQVNEALVKVVKDLAVQIADLQATVAAIEAVYPAENDRDATQSEINKNTAAWIAETEAKMELISSKLGV